MMKNPEYEEENHEMHLDDIQNNIYNNLNKSTLSKTQWIHKIIQKVFFQNQSQIFGNQNSENKSISQIIQDFLTFKLHETIYFYLEDNTTHTGNRNNVILKATLIPENLPFRKNISSNSSSICLYITKINSLNRFHHGTFPLSHKVIFERIKRIGHDILLPYIFSMPPLPARNSSSLTRIVKYIHDITFHIQALKRSKKLPVPSPYIFDFYTPPNNSSFIIVEMVQHIYIQKWSLEILQSCPGDEDPIFMVNKKKPNLHDEIQYWAFQKKRLDKIYRELQSDEIRQVLSFLDNVYDTNGNDWNKNKTLLTKFAKSCKRLFWLRISTSQNYKVTQFLKGILFELDCGLSSGENNPTIFYPMFHVFSLLWKTNPHYNSDPKNLVRFFHLLVNHVLVEDGFNDEIPIVNRIQHINKILKRYGDFYSTFHYYTHKQKEEYESSTKSHQQSNLLWISISDKILLANLNNSLDHYKQKKEYLLGKSIYTNLLRDGVIPKDNNLERYTSCMRYLYDIYQNGVNSSENKTGDSFYRLKSLVKHTIHPMLIHIINTTFSTELYDNIQVLKIFRPLLCEKENVVSTSLEDLLETCILKPLYMEFKKCRQDFIEQKRCTFAAASDTTRSNSTIIPCYDKTSNSNSSLIPKSTIPPISFKISLINKSLERIQDPINILMELFESSEKKHNSLFSSSPQIIRFYTSLHGEIIEYEYSLKRVLDKKLRSCLLDDGNNKQVQEIESVSDSGPCILMRWVSQQNCDESLLLLGIDILFSSSKNNSVNNSNDNDIRLRHDDLLYRDYKYLQKHNKSSIQLQKLHNNLSNTLKETIPKLLLVKKQMKEISLQYNEMALSLSLVVQLMILRLGDVSSIDENDFLFFQTTKSAATYTNPFIVLHSSDISSPSQPSLKRTFSLRYQRYMKISSKILHYHQLSNQISIQLSFIAEIVQEWSNGNTSLFKFMPDIDEDLEENHTYIQYKHLTIHYKSLYHSRHQKEYLEEQKHSLEKGYRLICQYVQNIQDLFRREQNSTTSCESTFYIFMDYINLQTQHAIEMNIASSLKTFLKFLNSSFSEMVYLKIYFTNQNISQKTHTQQTSSKLFDIRQYFQNILQDFFSIPFYSIIANLSLTRNNSNDRPITSSMTTSTSTSFQNWSSHVISKSSHIQYKLEQIESYVRHFEDHLEGVQDRIMRITQNVNGLLMNKNDIGENYSNSNTYTSSPNNHKIKILTEDLIIREINLRQHQVHLHKSFNQIQEIMGIRRRIGIGNSKTNCQIVQIDTTTWKSQLILKISEKVSVRCIQFLRLLVKESCHALSRILKKQPHTPTIPPIVIEQIPSVIDGTRKLHEFICSQCIIFGDEDDLDYDVKYDNNKTMTSAKAPSKITIHDFLGEKVQLMYNDYLNSLFQSHNENEEYMRMK